MSTPYLYHPKVLHAGEILPQMTSGEYQPAFYFGGSQVPDILQTEQHKQDMKGYGLHKTYLKGIPKATIPIHQHFGAGIGSSRIVPEPRANVPRRARPLPPPTVQEAINSARNFMRGHRQPQLRRMTEEELFQRRAENRPRGDTEGSTSSSGQGMYRKYHR